MRNDKPVVFSTWGFDYAPPVDLKHEKIEYTIKDYLKKQGDIEEKHEEGVKTFIAFKTYLIEETEDNQYNVYIRVAVNPTLHNHLISENSSVLYKNLKIEWLM